MFLAVIGAKGAPGVTTTALALGAVWPCEPEPVLVAECDPSGADLPYLVRARGGDHLDPHRGVTSLVAAARGRTVTAEVVSDHTQIIDGGMQVLVGPAGHTQADALRRPGWDTLVSALSAFGARGDVLADCGQLTRPDTLAAPVLAAADAVLVVARPTPASVAHLRTTIALAAQIRDGGLDQIGVVLIDDPGPMAQAGPLASWKRARAARQMDEVLDATPELKEVSALGVLAWDPRTAAAWAGAGPGVASKAPLTTTAATVAAAAVDWVEDITLATGGTTS